MEELKKASLSNSKQNKFYDEKNKKLAAENEELRISALESIELVKVYNLYSLYKH